ncbi:LPD28 domain-containing protein [Ruminococcus flavefaciens]|uniref:LPD28 domain-containing protein n=1 Tax=Ruminococcus flavefaciens TaxID=1265 RepID=UPI0015644647|nr:LPD28 domain-containing protein [Ruminococcus flavefaciens]
MKINAAEESFELMELFGKTVIFTNMRIDRSTVPDGLYVYELRDEDCTGEICEIKPFVMVNHWGTIICKEPIELDTKWNSKFVDEGDYCYLGDTAKLNEYLNTDYSEEQSEKLEMS